MRIHELVIPPAWKDVWICPYPGGHIQATGIDAARPQAVPLPPALARAARPAEVRRHGRASPARCRGCASASTRDLDARRPVARARPRRAPSGCSTAASSASAREDYAVRERDLRPGDDAEAPRALRGDGTLLFDYPAKHGKRRVQAVVDPEVADVVARAEAPARRRRRAARLQARRAAGTTSRSADINAYLKEATGARRLAPRTSAPGARPCSPRSALAVAGRRRDTKTARKRAITRAVKEVAHYLGNTPAVARASYIDPRVFDRYLDGQVDRRRARLGADGRRRHRDPGRRRARRARPATLLRGPTLEASSASLRVERLDARRRASARIVKIWSSPVISNVLAMFGSVLTIVRRAVARAQALDGADQHAERGGVEERRLGEVDDDPRARRPRSPR